MEDMASLWSYQESLDELERQLLYTTLELEMVRAQSNEEMRKNTDYVNQLLQFLKIACKERDEARNQIHKLLNKFIPTCNAPTEIFAGPPQIQPESLMIKPAKANSITTESNSLSDAYNYQSPNDHFFDVVSSPELSKINMADSSNLGYVNQPFVVDQGCLVIEKIVKGKTLPQKGKFLQAVLEAGPLLKTLLVAGPLPRWKNPPSIQAIPIPPVSICCIPRYTITGIKQSYKNSSK